jgi:RTX calcium-binding nonapeptide repeat (4 copies)
LLSVSIDGNQDNDFNDAGEQAITDFQVSSVSGSPPASFKFGFAAGTGANTNIHEIRNLSIVPITDAPETADAGLNLAANSTANVIGLSATDADGIASFTINTLPDPTQGSLFLGNPASGGTPIAAGQSLTSAQIAQVFFRSTPGFNRLTTFTYSATDTLGAEDATPGVVSVAPIGTPLPIPTPVPIPPDDEDRRRGCRPGEGIEGNRRRNRLVGANNTLDRIFGRRGNDKLRGEGCSDVLNGGLGSDVVSGNAGSDRIKGRRGRDKLRGNDGNDVLLGQQSNDIVRGGKGSDRINAGAGDDRMNGGFDNDNIRARNGRDLARGGAGRDTIRGQQDNDKLLGGRGNDTLIGGQGADLIIGGRGTDTLFGKAGADQYVFRTVRDRGDLIRDFETFRDVIVVSQITSRSGYGSAQPFADYIRLVESGGNTIVRLDTNGDASGGFKPLVTLVGIDPGSLSAANFVV